MKYPNKKTFSSIHFDSRTVLPGSLFVAIRGVAKDGNAFIDEAIDKGAKIIIHERKLKNKRLGVKYIQVTDSHLALAEIAQDFYGNPSKKLKLVGVTGTNGKTTTATLLFKLFRSLGYKVALLSTIENKINDEAYPATHTTPDPVALASFLHTAVEQGCSYAFMECSSHAIDQKRIARLVFAGAIFTNLTLDHLDYHKTLAKYAKAKSGLFQMLSKKSFALGNMDDKKCVTIFGKTKAKKYTFDTKNPKANFFAQIKQQTLSGLTLCIGKTELQTKLIGNFNAYNVLGIFAAAKLLGVPENKIIAGIEKLDPPAGRLEFLTSNSGVCAVIDYAHTPDALENVLNTLNELKTETGKIITTIGCGGDRDKTKRPIMGEIACKLSDYVVFTSDNPRSEDPEEILKDMIATLSKTGGNYECIADRKKAIQKICRIAKPGDIILTAGKGHETYQVLKNKTVHLSDTEELKKYLKK